MLQNLIKTVEINIRCLMSYSEITNNLANPHDKI